MAEKTYYDFDEQLAFSKGIAHSDDLFKDLKELLCAEEYWAAPIDMDKSGTDYIFKLHDGTLHQIDFKNSIKYNYQDYGHRLVIEVTSKYYGKKILQPRDKYRGQIGWTLDDSKNAHWIIYTWPDKCVPDSRHWYIAPMFALREASKKYWRQWEDYYGVTYTPNKGYWTLNVLVPRRTVEKAMNEVIRGTTGVDSKRFESTIKKQKQKGFGLIV
jgi:hypothetical protein